MCGSFDRIRYASDTKPETKDNRIDTALTVVQAVRHNAAWRSYGCHLKGQKP